MFHVFYGSATNNLELGYVSVGWLVGCWVPTQISNQAISCLSGPWLVTGKLFSHCQCIVHVHTHMGARAQHSQKLSRKICMSVNIAGGSFNTSKYIEQVIEVDELNEGNLSAAEGEDK